MPLKILSPKELVTKSPELKSGHQRIVDSPHFEMSVALSLSELARMNPTQEQLKGANAFIEIFSNLAEKMVESSPAFPHKHLTHVGKSPDPEKK